MEDNNNMKDTFKMYMIHRDIPITQHLEWVITDPKRVRKNVKKIYDYINKTNVQGDSLEQ